MSNKNYSLITIGTKGTNGFRRIRWRKLNRKYKFPFLLTNFFTLFTIIQLQNLNEKPILISNFFTLLTILSIMNLNEIKPNDYIKNKNISNNNPTMYNFKNIKYK
eukprot:19504_1